VAQKRADVPISIEIKREKDVIKIGIWEAHFPVRGRSGVTAPVHNVLRLKLH
jgi:hypothetical protein